MKNILRLSLLLLACLPVAASAQKLIAVHHQGAASFFTDLPAAYNAAVNGDTLYLPGGSFDGLTLQKSLALIGVGYHPDSTSATGGTVLSSLSLSTGASNSLITGILINGFLYSDGTVSNVVISRCYVKQGIALHASSGAKTNWIISENWIGTGGYFYGGYSIQCYQGSVSNFLLSNNVIQDRVHHLASSEISNNIFLSNELQASNSTIRNNVFAGNYETSTSNSQWHNNLNAGLNGGPSGNGNIGSGNYLDNLPLETAFVNYSGSNTFYQNNFHLVNPAYLGNDGTPIGIYGGAFPWKEGSLPFTPHIRSKTIGATTNPDGTLHINLVVKAQGN